jgi:predicted GIY-YIG superfamily endonuclease
VKSPKETAYSGQGSAEAGGGGFPLVSADSAGHFTREKCAVDQALASGSPTRGLALWRAATALESRARFLREAARAEGLVGPFDVKRFQVEAEEYGWALPPSGVLDGSASLHEFEPWKNTFNNADAADYVGVTNETFRRLMEGQVLNPRHFHRRDELNALIGILTAPHAHCYPLTEQEHLAVSALRAEKPRRSKQALHLYVLEIDGVCTKIGITDKPQKRLASHTKSARDHGAEIGRAWVSIRHAEARANETRLQGKSPTEYLKVPFQRVMNIVAKLPMTRAVALLALLAITACAPASHEAEPPSLPAIDTPTEEPAPKTPYAVFASNSLDPSAIEAAHVRQASRILNDRLGDEVFVWSGFADGDLGCDTVLVTRGASDGVYLEGCRWTVELAEGGTESDAEVVTILRLLLVTIDGPHWEQS